MIVGISGKMQSGKDTVALMWQYIDDCHRFSYDNLHINDFKSWYTNKHNLKSDYKIKYFAGKLRKFVSDIIGMSIEDLMKDEIKNTIIPSFSKTPRQLLQLIGTEVCRVIDSNFHIIALMNDYKGQEATMWRDDYKFNHKGWPTEEDEIKGSYIGILYPNWLIPDTRFPNELKAIEDRNGVVIRVERSWENRYPKLWKQYSLDKTDRTNGFLNWLSYEDGFSYFKHTHPSETSLNNHQFEYIINNNDTLEELLEAVKITYTLINNKNHAKI